MLNERGNLCDLIEFLMFFVIFAPRPIHGLVFLFKWVPNEEASGTIVQDNRLDKIFFAKQVGCEQRFPFDLFVFNSTFSIVRLGY